MTHKLFPAIVMAAWASFATAQPTQAISEFTLGEATLDLAVPESPAFSALGLTPQQVTRPTSGRELAASFLSGIDRNGSFQTGLAIDTAPYMLLAGSRITLDHYRNPGQYLRRFLARWQLSFATSKGGGSGDPSAKIALGMRFTLFDLGDPRTDEELLECLAGVADTVWNGTPPESPCASDEEIERENLRRQEEIRRLAGPCRKQASNRRWNRSAWVFGTAPTWTSLDGKTAQIEYSGTALWTSLGFGFENVPFLEDHAMLAGYVKTRSKEVVQDQLNPGSSIRQDNFTIGTRLFVGVPKTQFNFETLWSSNDRADTVEDKYWSVGFGLEQRVVDNLWLNLSYGWQLAREQIGNGFVVFGGLNWGVGQR